MSFDRDMLLHFIAGACGGTMGAIVTCPLEIVKTRLQSSSFSMMSLPPPAAICKAPATCSTLPGVLNHGTIRKVSTSAVRSQVVHLSHQFPGNPSNGSSPRSLSLGHCLRYILKVEGLKALWRGLGPNLVGVAPSRAIYFCSYSQMRKALTTKVGFIDGPIVHILAASWAGFSSTTVTNPIWLIKTKLQLDHSTSDQRVGTWKCIKQIYNTKGFFGFYKGMTASYYGISETVIQFVIYENIKKRLQSYRPSNSNNWVDYLAVCMVASPISKAIASCLCYPHEVARTRLREDSKKYRSFWQTLGVVLKEEGWHGVYRGLPTQLIRQIPNTFVMFCTYESIVYYSSRYFDDSENEFYEEYED